MKKALLFGLNYSNTPECLLRGCINDVNNMSAFLKDRLEFDEITVHTDDAKYPRTTGRGILQDMNSLAVECWKDHASVAWIHFSGHGTRGRDWNGDEKDGYDECIVPSDFKTGGLIPDDYIKRILRNFPPFTKVVVVFDCCHSGTIADLKYRYENVDTVVEENTQSKCKARVVMLSGCTDKQTSADAYNVMNRRKFTGAMTSCLLTCMDKHTNPKVFHLLNELRDTLKEKEFQQFPQLCSSVKLSEDDKLF